MKPGGWSAAMAAWGRAILRRASPLGILAAGSCLLLILLGFLAPIASALHFGRDEGYELMKGMLWSQGHSLYQPLWNDQPPLHTMLLGLLFRCFGPSAFTGRLLSLGFGCLLLAAFSFLVGRRAGVFAAAMAVFLLLASPHFLELSVSVMLEVPAMAMAMAGAWALASYLERPRRWCVVLSGVMFAGALQTKLTAVIFLPALLAEWLLAWWPRSGPGQAGNFGCTTARIGLAEFALWLASMGAVYVGIAWLNPGGGLDLLWSSHMAAGSTTEAARAYAFKFGRLADNYECLIPALVGFGFIMRRRAWNLLFPVVLLTTVCTVHRLHQPYWYYYHLHFAIPLAWLAGLGLDEVRVWAFSVGRLPRAAALTGAIGISLMLVCTMDRLSSNVQRLRAAESATDNAVVHALRRHAGETRWIYTDQVIYAFHAGLAVPPELAVVPLKRIWSRRVTGADVMACLRKYKPEQVLLFGEALSPVELPGYLRHAYVSETICDRVTLHLRVGTREELAWFDTRRTP